MAFHSVEKLLTGTGPLWQRVQRDDCADSGLTPEASWEKMSGLWTAMKATQADYDQLMALYNAVESVFYTDEKVLEIVSDEAAAYFAGDKGLDECAAQIQSRVKLYVNEQR